MFLPITEFCKCKASATVSNVPSQGLGLASSFPDIFSLVKALVLLKAEVLAET